MAEIKSHSLVFQNGQLFRSELIDPTKPEDGTRLKFLGDFNMKTLASDGDGNYLIQKDHEKFVTTLDFTASLQQFKSFIRPAVFEGSTKDLEQLVAWINQDIRHATEYKLIYIKNRVGYVKEDRWPFLLWIFKDSIMIKNLKEDSVWKVLPIKERQVVDFEGFYIYVDNSNIKEGLKPVLFHSPEYTREDLALFLQTWLNQLKDGTLLLYTLLGWFISSLFLDEVNAWRGRPDFPYFVVSASTNSGKTALLANCMRFFGIVQSGESFTATSLHVEVLHTSQLGHIPIWRDEYKLEGHALKKDTWLRSMFDRHETTKGTAQQGQISYPTRATLLLSGEDITEDSATLRRMLLFTLKKDEKVSEEEHEMNTCNARDLFGYAFPAVLERGLNKEIFQKLMKEQLKTENSKNDELMCYAALGSVFGLDVGLKAIELANAYHSENDGKVIAKNETAAEQFFKMVLACFTEKKFFTRFMGNDKPQVMEYFQLANKGQTLYMRFEILQQLLRRFKAKEDYVFTRKGMGRLLAEAYNGKTQSLQFRGIPRSVMSFQNIEILPPPLQEIIAHLSVVEKEWEDSQHTDISIHAPSQGAFIS